jgi:hypothetical protein
MMKKLAITCMLQTVQGMRKGRNKCRPKTNVCMVALQYYRLAKSRCTLFLSRYSMLWFALLKVVIKQANIVLRIIVPFKLQ